MWRILHTQSRRSAREMLPQQSSIVYKGTIPVTAKLVVPLT